MNITKSYEVTFDTEEHIVATTASSSDQLVLLMSSGRVFRYHLNERSFISLFRIKNLFTYPDDGFDIQSPITIYTLDDIVVIVNNFKCHGYVHYPGKYRKLHLWRKGYHEDISSFPIALFKNNEGVPHLIYGAAWNHIQIMNLDTRQILTAAKSLIETNAEERHIEFYKNHKEDDKQAWPSPYDYFFGRLEMSPDHKYFLSAGWVWGSLDSCEAFDVNQFIHEARITPIDVAGGEHEDRAVCWVNETTIAIATNPCLDELGEIKEDSSDEIHFYAIDNGEAIFQRKIEIPEYDILHSKMCFDGVLSALVCFSEQLGVLILSVNGEVLLKDNEICPDTYSKSNHHFIKSSGQTLTTYRISKP